MNQQENPNQVTIDELIGNVPVKVAAKVYGKDPQWIRVGIISGYLKIGFATRKGVPVTSLDELNGKKGRINYYISPKLLYEATGYAFKGEAK